MLLVCEFNTDELAIVVNFLHASMKQNGEGYLWWFTTSTENWTTHYVLPREVRVLVCKTWMLIVGWINEADVHRKGYKSSILLLALRFLINSNLVMHKVSSPCLKCYCSYCCIEDWPQLNQVGIIDRYMTNVKVITVTAILSLCLPSTATSISSVSRYWILQINSPMIKFL
jgi:hypothetical protein